ncbi:MAG: acyltransferase [Leptospira sp.]|nr:acyltransferase [Leptospira sp.]
MKKFKLLEIIYLEIEQTSYFPFKYIPGVIGFFLRYLFVKLMAKKLNGMIWIPPGVELLHLRNIIFGKNVGINVGTYINGVGSIIFEDFVMVGSNVTINSEKKIADKMYNQNNSDSKFPEQIILKEGCWLAAGTVVFPGVTVGKGSVLGANSLASKNIPDFEIYAGAPAKKIRSREIK